MKGAAAMDAVDKILKDPRYVRYIGSNAEAEKDRIFCRHDLQHAFDVARVAYIMDLERDLRIKKEKIYIAAILHDIAKWKQYGDGTDHALEGSVLAADILKDAGVGREDAEEIMDAIRTHRKKDLKRSSLGAILYESDKSCRLCCSCRSIDGCRRFADGRIAETEY